MVEVRDLVLRQFHSMFVSPIILSQRFVAAQNDLPLTRSI